MSNSYYRLVRVKRGWVPEWLWWWICNPIPFWNELMPYYRVSIKPLAHVLSEPVEEVAV